MELIKLWEFLKSFLRLMYVQVYTIIMFGLEAGPTMYHLVTANAPTVKNNSSGQNMENQEPRDILLIVTMTGIAIIYGFATFCMFYGILVLGIRGNPVSSPFDFVGVLNNFRLVMATSFNALPDLLVRGILGVGFSLFCGGTFLHSIFGDHGTVHLTPEQARDLEKQLGLKPDNGDEK